MRHGSIHHWDRLNSLFLFFISLHKRDFISSCFVLNLFRCDLLVSRTPPWWHAPVSAATPTVCTLSRGHTRSYCSPSEVVCGEISHMRWWRQSWSGDVITCVRGCSTRSLLSRPNLWVSRGCWRRGRGLLRGCSAWCRQGPVVTSQDKHLLWRRAQRFYIC